MKKNFSVWLILILLCSQCLSVLAEESFTFAEYGLCFQDTDVMAAVKRICLLFQGNGSWADAEIETVGCYLMDEQKTDSSYTLLVYTTHSVYDLDASAPKYLAGSHYPVVIKFAQAQQGQFKFISYSPQEDGADMAKWISQQYGSHFSLTLTASHKDFFYNQARQDADRTAQICLSGQKASLAPHTWHEFLKSGSNAQAMQLVADAIDSKYPTYAGCCILDVFKCRYQLSLEGENSYSGILTFSSYDQHGMQLSYVRLQAQGDQLVILDGQLPPIPYE